MLCTAQLRCRHGHTHTSARSNSPGPCMSLPAECSLRCVCRVAPFGKHGSSKKFLEAGLHSLNRHDATCLGIRTLPHRQLSVNVRSRSLLSTVYHRAHTSKRHLRSPSRIAGMLEVCATSHAVFVRFWGGHAEATSGACSRFMFKTGDIRCSKRCAVRHIRVFRAPHWFPSVVYRTLAH